MGVKKWYLDHEFCLHSSPTFFQPILPVLAARKVYLCAAERPTIAQKRHASQDRTRALLKSVHHVEDNWWWREYVHCESRPCVPFFYFELNIAMLLISRYDILIAGSMAISGMQSSIISIKIYTTLFKSCKLCLTYILTTINDCRWLKCWSSWGPNQQQGLVNCYGILMNNIGQQKIEVVMWQIYIKGNSYDEERDYLKEELQNAYKSNHHIHPFRVRSSRKRPPHWVEPK